MWNISRVKLDRLLTFQDEVIMIWRKKTWGIKTETVDQKPASFHQIKATTHEHAVICPAIFLNIISASWSISLEK